MLGDRFGHPGRPMSTTTAICHTPLAAELAAARSRTDFLFRILSPEALYARPIGERHRMVFYVGHLEAFDWNMVCRRGLGRASFHPEFDKLFEFGIDPAEGNLPTDKESDWPSVDEVRSYNRRVRAELDTAIEHAPEQILRVAIEHRWMHAETLAETWKSYALAYEVLCEAAAEKDSAGASNAGAAVAEARRILSALGQYDA